MLKHTAAIAAVLAIAVAVVPTSAFPGERPTTAPGILRQDVGVYRFHVGDVRVTALSDGTVPQDLHKLLLGTTAAKTDAALARGFLANPVEASINAYLIEMGDRRVLVDTGSGELFGPGFGGRLAESLAAAGTPPDRVTDVLITHVHTDHTGGLVKGGARVFPNATVHVGKPDVDFFLDRANADTSHYDAKYFDEAATTLKPYLDAGQLKPFAGTTEVVPGITATLHPGHTPGSAFYTLASGGERIVFVGDIIHVSAVQFPEPAITIAYDVDPKGAARVRAEQFPVLVRERTLIAAPHLPFPGVGHVRAAEHGFAWVPADYGNRAP
ncbi:MBL fold metallo-hydrolase (plasmid) [Methylobacterium sp. NMS12]|uniref:MBL fold metallo-hydrolase n=1 Tax=Methylobacterium sp. NMS12 TaxID=3079766 RepID=UPI003F883125